MRPRLSARAKRRVVAKKLEVSRRTEGLYVAALRAVARDLHDRAVSWILSRRDGLLEDFWAFFRGLLGGAAKRVGRLFDRMSKAVSSQNAKAMKSVGVQALSDFRVADEVSKRRQENIALVEKAATEHAEDLLTRPSEELDARGSVLESRAQLIATDQILALNGALTEIRQTNAGIHEYIWSTSLDERVRPEHVAREGVKFSWYAPPPDGHPGEPINCRCVPLPVIPELDGL